MKQVFVLLCLLHLTVSSFAQQDRTVEGIVFDKDSKQRISHVYLYNLRTGKGFFNNLKGEFSTTARSGDVFVAAAEGFAVDTIKLKEEKTLVIYLKRTSILLKDVLIRDTVLSPKAQLEANKKEYSKIYRSGDNSDVLQTGGANGAGGIGLSIDAIYSMLSKQGKNARQLQKIIERDYRDAIIRYRYTSSLVSKVTKLSGEKLADFMQQYRPSYYFVLEANDYAMIKFIKESYRQYEIDPAANRLPPLVPPKKP